MKSVNHSYLVQSFGFQLYNAETFRVMTFIYTSINKDVMNMLKRNQDFIRLQFTFGKSVVYAP